MHKEKEPGTKNNNIKPQTNMEYENPMNETEYKMGWLLPLLLTVLAAALVLYFVQGSINAKSGYVPGTDTAAAAAKVRDSIFKRKADSLSIHLNNGTELWAKRNGIEKQLIVYINSKDSISKDRWFDFDNLNFETGSAAITDSSLNQIKNIVAILKAYPKVKIKIGGYTDKTGNEEDNLKLSQDRANAVLLALKTNGADAAQLEGAEGYGSQFAKAAADAPDEEKQKDRRISINVRAK